MNINRYLNFVSNCDKQNQDKEGYFEYHHIEPKCTGGDDNPTNLCKLTGRQHFIAHWMLCRVYPEELKIQQSFHIMFLGTSKVQRTHYNSKAYEECKRRHSETMKGVFPIHWDNYHSSITNSERFKGKVRVFHKDNKEKSFYVTKEEFESNPNLTSWSKGTTIAYDENGNKLRVIAGDPRLKTGSLKSLGSIIAQNNKGENNAMFTGWYITPLGKHATSGEAAIAHGVDSQTVITRCRTNNKKPISHANTIHRSKDLNMIDHKHYIGQSWEELGWGFTPA